MGYLNADNAYIKYGREEGTSLQDAGSYCYDTSGRMTTEITIDLTTLTELEVIQNDVAVIPDNAMIEQVEVVTVVAGATGAAIDVGLVHISRNTSDPEFTAVPTALLAAFANGTMDLVGERSTFTQTYTIPAATVGTGLLVGEVTAAPTLITASRTTGTAFTAGRVLVRITYKCNGLTGTSA